MLERSGITGTDDVLGGVNCGVSAVHPESGGIEGLTFLDHLGNVVSFTALVSCTPEEDAGVVTVTEDHLPYPFTVHGSEFGHVADILSRMSLVTGLVDHEKTVFVSEVEVLVHGRIVGSTYGVEVEFLQNFDILTDNFLCHCVTHFGMLHVGALGAYLQRNSVEVENAVTDLSLLESYPFVY